MIIIPHDMFGVPEERRDTSKAENVRWLLRSLVINNPDHPEVDVICSKLRKLSSVQIEI